MTHRSPSRLIPGTLLALLGGVAAAGEVGVLAVDLREGQPGRWQISTTLEHADTGWEHYADAWRVVTPDGDVLGTRTLYHPHVDEQPFTRSLSVAIPGSVRRVFVEAHDSRHGWSAQRIEVDLDAATGGRLRITR